MDFSLSAQQTMLRENVRRFCSEHYSSRHRLAQVHAQTGDSRKTWKRFAELGWLGAALPADVHGSQVTAVETAIIMEEFGRALVVEPYWSCAVMTGQLLNQCATPHQRAELLAPLVRGEMMLAVAHYETDGSGQLEHIEAVALAKGNGTYLVSGRKSMVVGGPAADKFIVSARIPYEAPSGDRISLFVIDRNSKGLSRLDYQLLDGSLACDLELVDVLVTEAELVGEKHSGMAAINYAADQAMVGLCSEAVGVIDSVLWMTRDYLRLRRQYGVPIATFQALQHRMADIFIEVELSRSILLRALSILGEKDPRIRRAGVLAALIHVCRSGLFACKNGIQLHGALGMTEEHMIGQYFKRLVVISGLFGGMDFHLERFAAELRRVIQDEVQPSRVGPLRTS